MKRFFIVVMLVILPGILSPIHGQWQKHTIDSNLPQATVVYVADIDGDTDLDLAATAWTAGDVVWYENNLPNPNWSRHTIDGNLNDVICVHVADIDGDNDSDVIAAGYGADDVVWYENILPDPNWSKHTIDANLDGAEWVYVADIDSDTDLDVAATGSLAGDVVWYENILPVTTWPKHTIDANLGRALQIRIADIDGDDTLDVVAAGGNVDDIVWYENGGGTPITWTKWTIDGNLDGAIGVSIGDIDGDTNLDVAAVGQFANEVVWYTNNLPDENWTKNHIANLNDTRMVDIADINGDTYLDVVATSIAENDVVWYLNNLPDLNWPKETIDANLGGARVFFTADIDDDYDTDVIALGQSANDVVWYENLHGTIYAINTKISKPYMIPSYDTLIVRTEFSNINQHNFTTNAIYTSSDSIYIDSTALYDDGLHGDSFAGDGLWGGYIYPISEENIFQIGISTLDIDTADYLYMGDLTRFTTAGPLKLDSVSYTKGHLDYYNIKPIIRNAGTSMTIPGAKVRLFCDDPWVASMSAFYISLPDIPPGIRVEPNSNIVVTYINSLFPGYFNLRAEITSDGWIYWKDTLQVIITGVEKEELQPLSYKLEQNYPNPFNPTTTIKYQIPELSIVTIKVYDVLGSEVATLVNEDKPVGYYESDFNAARLSSGVYFYRIQAGDFIETKKMVLLR